MFFSKYNLIFHINFIMISLYDHYILYNNNILFLYNNIINNNGNFTNYYNNVKRCGYELTIRVSKNADFDAKNI